MRMYMRWCKGTVDINFGIEHRMRQEGLEEQFNILLTRMKAVKVPIMRMIFFLLQLSATWER